MRRKQTPNRKVIKNTTTDLSSSDRQSVNKMKGNNLGEKNILTDANNSMNLNISHVGSQQTKNVTKTGVKSSQIDDIPIPADVSAINSLNKEVNSQISNTTLQSIILEETTLPNNIKITDEKLDLNKLITITEEAPDAIHTTTVQNETLMSENAGEAQATEIPTEELGETTTYNMSNDEIDEFRFHDIGTHIEHRKPSDKSIN
nr:MIP24765p [Drosophila melanogaster]